MMASAGKKAEGSDLPKLGEKGFKSPSEAAVEIESLEKTKNSDVQEESGMKSTSPKKRVKTEFTFANLEKKLVSKDICSQKETEEPRKEILSEDEARFTSVQATTKSDVSSMSPKQESEVSKIEATHAESKLVSSMQPESSMGIEEKGKSSKHKSLKTISPKKISPLKFTPETLQPPELKSGSESRSSFSQAATAPEESFFSELKKIKIAREEARKSLAEYLVDERESRLYGNQVPKRRLDISARNFSAKRIQPEVVATSKGFRIVFDVSRFDKESISINITGNKIDVYAKDESQNEYGQEFHEMHQIFRIPDYVDQSGFSACIKENGMIFIDAPVKIKKE